MYKCKSSLTILIRMEVQMQVCIGAIDAVMIVTYFWCMGLHVGMNARITQCKHD